MFQTPKTPWPAMLVAAAALLGGCDHLADRALNRVYEDPRPSAEDKAFHETLLVADLHADSLLWRRDLLDGTRLALSERPLGHVDLNRLRAGNVSLQAFTIATKYPFSLGDCQDRHGWNPIGLLWVMQGRPIETWFSLKARALEQARQLHAFAQMSEIRAREDPAYPELVIIKSVADLERVIDAFVAKRPVVGAWLGIEGAHWLGGVGMSRAQLEAEVEELYEAGIRMIAPTHNFDNDLAEASEGCDEQDGLTASGRIVLKRAHDLGMVVDLAHASSETIRNTLDLVPGPVVVSHTGLASACEESETCSGDRNLGDHDVKAIARAGGVIGVGYWPQAVGRPGLSRAAGAMARVVKILETVGEIDDPFEHLAFGSDFDGAVSQPIDASGMARMTGALRRQADADGRPVFSVQAIRKIAGGNVCRVLALRLSGGGPDAAQSICRPFPGRTSTLGGRGDVGQLPRR